GVQKLEGKQLPNFSLLQTGDGQAEFLDDSDVAVIHEHALENEGYDEDHDQNRGHTRRVVRIPHVEAIRQSHGWASLAWKRLFFNSEIALFGAWGMFQWRMPSSEALFDSPPEIYQVQTRAAGPAGTLPYTDEMLLHSPSGDLFGLSQNAGMGWNP